jgi:hypothetical protein
VITFILASSDNLRSMIPKWVVVVEFT